jgi:PAS domain S-box-containing protein
MVATLRWRLLAVLLVTLGAAAEAAAPSPVRIGIVAQVPQGGTGAYGAALVHYLQERLPQRTITAVYFQTNELAAAAAGRGELEFLYVTSATFAGLEARHGATAIATAKVRLRSGVEVKFTGGVIFCGAHRDGIQRLGDLRGKRVVGFNPESLGGWIAALREFRAEGIDPAHDFASLRFAPAANEVAQSVVDGSADAGVVSIAQFSRMIAGGKYSAGQLRVLPPRIPYPELQLVPVPASTRLYPATPFIRMRHVPDDLAEEMAAALYRMPPPEDATRFMGVVSWSLPMNYQSVHDCLRELGISPYDKIEQEALSTLVERHWRTILLAVSIVAVILAGTTILAVIARFRLAQSQKILTRQASLLEQTSDGVYAVGPDYRITYWNKAAHILCGVSSHEAIGHRAEEVVPWAISTEDRFEARRKLESDGVWNGQVQLRTPAGEMRVVEVAASAIHGQHRRIAGAVVGLRDVTERKNLEEQLRQSQKMQAVGLLAGGVAHDFNNLLTVINGYAEIDVDSAKERGLSAPHTEQILKAGRRAAELTQQLLAFSRKQMLQPRAIDLNSLLHEMGQMLRRLIGEDIELVIAPSPDLPMILADPSQVRQVIMNLVVNARDATPPGGEIRLSTAPATPATLPAELRGAPRNGYVVLTVSDTGSGMDEAVRQRIFEPFFTTKELGKGTGLGLATVYGIVRQSSGHIEVTSAPGKGSCFCVYLPGVGSSHRETDSTKLQPVATGTESVLVVEDQPDVRALACAILRGAGYHVIEVESPAAALELLRREKVSFDVLLTDVIMPLISGPDLAQAIRLDRPNVKVLYMSGYSEDQIAPRESLAEGIAFLKKPFTIRDLELKIRLLLDGAGPALNRGGA